MVLMCGRVIAFAATLLIPLLLARLFSPQEFGTYKQVFLIYATLYGITQIGMAESLYYFLPRNPSEAGRYVLNAVLTLFLAGLGCVGLLIALQDQIAFLMNNSALASYIPLLGGNLLFMLASAPLEIALISRKKYRWASLVYGADVLRVAFFVVPILMWNSLYALLLGGMIFGIVRFGTALLHFSVSFGSGFRPGLRLFWRQLGYALPFALAVVVEIAHVNFHYYAVSYYFTAATFAVYAIGCFQIPLVDFIASPAGNVMMVLMSERLGEGRNAEVVSLWRDTTRKLALFFFPLAALLIVTAGVLIPFAFTERYVASVPIFMIWTLTILFSTLQTDAVLRVFAETRYILALNVARLAVVAGLTLSLIPVLGVIGAVVSAVLAMAAAKAIALRKIRGLLNVSWRELVPGRSLLAIAIAAVAACMGPVAVQAIGAMPPFFQLALSGLAYSAIYLVLMLRFRLLTRAERMHLAKWLRPSIRWSGSPAVTKLSEGWKV
jgi:O-antigen/teichoic acid export membrane protein